MGWARFRQQRLYARRENFDGLPPPRAIERPSDRNFRRITVGAGDVAACKQSIFIYYFLRR
jgi:hypothetical protein